MAITEIHPELTVSIESAEVPLQEHPDETPWVPQDGLKLKRGNHSSVYVQSQVGVEFYIKFEYKQPLRSVGRNIYLGCFISVDGQEVDAITLHPGGSSGEHVRYVKGHVNRLNGTQRSIRRLRFSALDKVDQVDNAQLKDDFKLAADLGEIRILLQRMTAMSLKHPVPAKRTRGARDQLERISQISEKALKGKSLSVGVSFGEEESFEAPSARYYKYSYLDDYKEPFAAYRFQYRSKADLQAEMIIPRSPSPTPASGGAQQLAQLKREMDQLRAEEGDESKDSIKNNNVLIIKRGREEVDLVNDDDDDGERPYKITRTRVGDAMVDTVDLTED